MKIYIETQVYIISIPCLYARCDVWHYIVHSHL